MDYRETEEQKMIRDMVHKFAQNEIKPISIEYDRKPNAQDTYPWDLLKKASALGLRTMSVPAEYGGGGIKDLTTLMLVVEELGYGDNGFAASIRHTIGLSAWMDALCTKAQKDEFFPQIVKDDTFVTAYAGTEPNSGTDNAMLAEVPGAGMQTYAEKVGDDYIINGAKHFISNGGIAKLLLLSARTDRKLPLSQCRSVFLVPSNTPGLTVGKHHNKLGRRLINSGQLFFDNMRVPARNMVKRETDAAKFQSFLIPATMIGTFRDAYDEVVAHCTTRIQGGKPIIRHQLVAAEISSMRVKIEAARALLYRQAWCWQNKYEYDNQLTLLIRPMLNQITGHMAYQIQELCGAPGVDKEMRFEKLSRDLLTMVHGPSTYAGYVRGAPGYVPQTELNG